MVIGVGRTFPLGGCDAARTRAALRDGPLFARNSWQARNCLILLWFIGRIRRMKLRTFNNQHGIAIGPIPFTIAALAIP